MGVVVNMFQNQNKRKLKYNILRRLGADAETARRARDFRDFYFLRVCEFYINNGHFGSGDKENLTLEEIKSMLEECGG